MSLIKRCIGCHSNSLSRDSKVYVCGDCSLRFEVDEIGIDYVSTYSDEESLYFEHFKNIDHFQTMPIHQLRDSLLPFESRLRQLFQERKNYDDLVDLGCGTGRFLRVMEGLLFNVQGYEVATTLVNRLQKYGRKIHQGGICEFLATEHTPDIVTLLEVIEHLPNPGELIQQILSVKSPELLAIVVPMWSIRRKFDSQFSIHDRPPNHLSWWNGQSLHTLLYHPGYSVSIEFIPEGRLSLLKKLVKDFLRGGASTSIVDWVQAFIKPPPFWILGLAQKIHEN